MMNMSRSTLISNILLEGEQLEIAQSVRLNCPKCVQHTFTITRSEQGVLYNCYRNSCDLEPGFIGVDKIARERMGPPKKKQRNVRFYHRPIELLNLEQRHYLQSRFVIEDDDIDRAGIRYAPADDKFVLPILDPRGYERGMDLHTWDKERDRKSIIYPHSADGAMCSWYQAHPGRPRIVVVVEDIMSAIRVARLDRHTGLALLGTALGADKLQELMNVNPAQVIIALDADATDTAYGIAWNNKLLFNRIRVAKLERDIKDMRSDNEVEEALYVQSI